MKERGSEQQGFCLLEATIRDIQEGYKSGILSVRELVRLYLDRIAAYDRGGPEINSIINVNPEAFTEAEKLDDALRSGSPVGPLHGVPVILKDQIDARGMPTTLGSLVFENYFPDRDAFIVEQLRKAGAIILAKATLGEMGGGDTHGSLFGSTRNPYGLDRTVGGSSGGPAASITANFGAVAVGQEGFASIRRPAAWNGIVGMRPTGGLVSRSGVYSGWPGTNGLVGPMTRTVGDLAQLLDVMVGYDPDDPMTALGIGQTPPTYNDSLREEGLQGARIGILRTTMGFGSEPDSEDFHKVSRVFDKAVSDLEAAGATVIDPIEIPRLRELLAKRANAGTDEAWTVYFGRSVNPPFKSREEMTRAPAYEKVFRRGASVTGSGPSAHYEYLLAREELMFHLLKTMADHDLDAIVHKSVEHQPTLISDALNPSRVNMKGATHLNTFLVYIPSISVPAGFTADGLPTGVTFAGRPYSDALMIKLAYAYEQATRHRQPPAITPPLPGEPQELRGTTR